MFEEIKKILSDELGIDEDTITLDSKIVDDLGADSLDVVELIMALEDAYGIEVSDDKAQKLHTVNDIIKYIETIK